MADTNNTQASEEPSMPINSVLAVMTVADFDAALVWYERLLGRPADTRPMDGLAQWQVTETGAIQLLRDAGRAGAALLTLGVDNLDERVADLAGRGLAVGAITTGVMARITAIADPEGNTITLTEPLGTAV